MSDNLDAFLDKFDNELFDIMKQKPTMTVAEVKEILDCLTDFFGRKYAHAVTSAIHVRDKEDASKFIDFEMEKLLGLVVYEIRQNREMEFLQTIIQGMFRNEKND